MAADPLRLETSGAFRAQGETGTMWIWLGTAFVLALLLTFAWMTK
jgi:hypothetical protein